MARKGEKKKNRGQIKFFASARTTDTLLLYFLANRHSGPFAQVWVRFFSSTFSLNSTFLLISFEFYLATFTLFFLSSDLKGIRYSFSFFSTRLLLLPFPFVFATICGPMTYPRYNLIICTTNKRKASKKKTHK